MNVQLASRVVHRVRFVPPFVSGDHLDQPTFHKLYEQCPPGFKAELIGGVVYVPSPTKFIHGRPHSRFALWVGTYAANTPGTDPLIETTNILNDRNEPQPDAALRLLEEYGGRSAETPDGYISGPAELIAEVANSSAAIDLHTKRTEYEAAGIQEYIVALVASRELVWLSRTRKGFSDLKPGTDGVIRSRVFPGLWLEPSAVFDRSPARVLTALQAGLASPEHAAFVAKLEARAAKRKPRPQP